MSSTPAGQLRTALPPTADSVPRARELIRSLYASTGVDADSDTVLLLVSELVSNAVRHAGGAVEVCARQVGSTLRVEVSDGSATMPQVQVHSIESTGGRGLQMVDELADRWGVDALAAGAGKTVWFEIGPDIA